MSYSSPIPVLNPTRHIYTCQRIRENGRSYQLDSTKNGKPILSEQITIYKKKESDKVFYYLNEPKINLKQTDINLIFKGYLTDNLGFKDLVLFQFKAKGNKLIIDVFQDFNPSGSMADYLAKRMAKSLYK